MRNQVLLGKIAESQTGPFGSQLHKEDYVEKGTPIVTVEHLGELGFTRQNLPLVSDTDVQRLNKYILKEGDIVFSRVGAIDRNTYVTKDENGWMFSGRCIRVRCDKTKVNPLYLSYYFKLEHFKRMMLNVSVGATMPSLNTDIMDSLPINLANRLEQDNIAACLALIDDKIRNNNAICSNLEGMAKLLYDYWFVQFDFSDENGRPYKSSGGKMVWNDELKREIPAGWKVSHFKDVINIGNGQDHKGLSNGNIPVYGSGGLIRKVNSSLYTGESVLIPRKGTLNNIMYVNESFWTVDTMFYTKMKRKYIAKYMYYATKIYNFERLNTGTGVPSMTTDIIYKLKVLLPKEELLKKYDKFVSSLFDAIKKCKAENQQLASLRDFLLPMLMNGQIRIKDSSYIKNHF